MLTEFDVFLADELGQRIAQLEGTAFATGDGTNKPLGAIANLTQLQAATGSTTKFRLADLTNAVHTVAPSYREPGQDPAWVMSDGCLKSLRTVVDTAGAAILIDPSSPGDRIRLLGFDVYVDENLAAPAANAKSCIFAGWRSAYIVRRVQGVSLMRQAELLSGSGQLGYRSTHRVDGRIGIAAAGVTLQHSAT